MVNKFAKKLAGNQSDNKEFQVHAEISEKDLWNNMYNLQGKEIKSKMTIYKGDGRGLWQPNHKPLISVLKKYPKAAGKARVRRANTAGTIFPRRGENEGGFYFNEICMIRTNCDGVEGEPLNTVKNIVKNIVKNSIKPELGEEVENFAKMWDEIILQLVEKIENGRSTPGLIEEILNEGGDLQHFKEWFPTTKNMGSTGTREAEVKPEAGTELNTNKIEILKDIFIRASSLIHTKFGINIAFYNDFKLVEEEVLYNKENREGNIYLIYYHIDVQLLRKLIDPIWFINIKTGETDRFLLEGSAVAQHFKTKYKMDASDSSKTEESTRVRNSPIYFNPMDKDANLPVILINGKEYLVGFPKDNDYRNLYLATDNHDLVGELNFQDCNLNQCNIWWCEQAQ
jgi:hypothetical protein